MDLIYIDRTIAKLHELSYELPPHPAYSPDCITVYIHKEMIRRHEIWVE